MLKVSSKVESKYIFWLKILKRDLWINQENKRYLIGISKDKLELFEFEQKLNLNFDILKL